MVSFDKNESLVFPCGLKLAFKRKSSPVAYCALTVRSGTVNEPSIYNGLAHLTEHMLFKGTLKRKGESINNRLERLGGELNAYTTKEETVVHSAVLKEDVLKAIDLIFEIVFTSVFSTKELDKERSVVMDEINLYKDSPSDYIFDDFEEFLFTGTPLSRPILGKSASLKKITSEIMKQYVSENFIPENMSLAIVGDFEFEKIKKGTARILKKYLPDCAETFPVSPFEQCCKKMISFEKGVVFNKDATKKNHQANCIIGASAYSLYDQRRIPLLLIANILGGPSSNSRLNIVLREKSALVYNIDVSYTQYSGTGVFMVYFGCDKNNLEKCLFLVKREIEKIRSVKMTQNALKIAKKQLLGQIAVSSDNGEAQSLAIGKSILSYGRVLSDDEIISMVESVTSDDIFSVAAEILSPERLSTLIYR